MVGQLLADRRKALGFSQTELARRAGSSQRQVSRLENNEEALPRRDTLERFGAVLGITLGEFYRAAGVVEMPEEGVPEALPRPAPLAEVIAIMERDPEIVAALAELKATQSEATYRRILVQLAEVWQTNGRMMMATWKLALGLTGGDQSQP